MSTPRSIITPIAKKIYSIMSLLDCDEDDLCCFDFFLLHSITDKYKEMKITVDLFIIVGSDGRLND